MEIENLNDEDHQQSTDFNEWGEYTGNKDPVKLEGDGVIQNILDNNPAISSVRAMLPRPRRRDPSVTSHTSLRSEVDWEVAGQCIAKSKHIKYLCWNYPDDCLDEDLEVFAKGVALNRSIEALELCGDRPMKEEIFDSLIPFFSGNIHLQSLKIDLKPKLPKNICTAIQSCLSLKSIMFGDDNSNFRDYHDVENALQLLSMKPELLSIRICGQYLRPGTCLAIKTLLSSDNCNLKSLMLSDVDLHRSDDASTIATGLITNKSVKCFKFHPRCFLRIKPFLSAMKGMHVSVLETVDIGAGRGLQ